MKIDRAHTLLKASVLYLFLLSSLGCQTRPMQFLMRGCMDVAGSMKMTGNMDMSGKIKAAIAPDNTASRLSTVSLVRDASKNCDRVAIVDVDGLIINKHIAGLGAMGENPVALFREKLEHLRLDSRIKAVVVRINSPGGGVTACDVLCHELDVFRESTGVPIVACIMDTGAGGAYYLASHADAIVAHPTSIVGGIGVILNVYNMEDTLSQFNVFAIPVKSGEKIDMATPERKLTQDERKALQSMADGFHQRFVEHIKKARPNLKNGPDLFDGSVVPGDRAADLGLIDQVGYIDDAIKLAKSMANLDESATCVMLRRDNDRAYTVLDASPNMPMQNSMIPIKVPGLDRSSMPTFLYLWQPDPSFLTASGG